MSRINVSYPFIFNSLSGVQPAQNLDDDFSAVPGGTVTIGGRVLAASYTLIADDDYSFFICLPTSNMNLTMPSSVATNFSFFVSNQRAPSPTVTLIATFRIGSATVTNPVLPGNYGGFTGVTGGYAIFDGSQWTLYPDIFGTTVSGGGTTPTPVFNKGNVTGAVTIDVSQGLSQKMILTGDISPVIVNMQNGQHIEMIFIQDSFGAHNITFSPSIRLAGGSFTPSAPGGQADTLQLIWDGTTFWEVCRATGM